MNDDFTLLDYIKLAKHLAGISLAYCFMLNLITGNNVIVTQDGVNLNLESKKWFDSIPFSSFLHY